MFALNQAQLTPPTAVDQRRPNPTSKRHPPRMERPPLTHRIPLAIPRILVPTLRHRPKDPQKGADPELRPHRRMDQRGRRPGLRLRRQPRH